MDSCFSVCLFTLSSFQIKKSIPFRCEPIPIPPSQRRKKRDVLEDICPDPFLELVDRDTYCNLIHDPTGPFSACIAEDPELAADIFDSCCFDVCHNADNDTNAKNAACSTLEVFEHYCLLLQEHEVDWREQAQCREYRSAILNFWLPKKNCTCRLSMIHGHENLRDCWRQYYPNL